MVMRPLEPDELLERCDLAGEAYVLTVRPDASGAGVVARLDFRKVAKGPVRALPGEHPNIASVAMRPRQPRPSEAPILGDWSDAYEPGTLVFNYLSWDPATGVYRTTWWNARTLLSEN
jgi:hypothetical protein